MYEHDDAVEHAVEPDRVSDSGAEETVVKCFETDIEQVIVGADNIIYKHKNACADGRCSIHATGDIIGLSIDETVVAFQDYVLERRHIAEHQLKFLASNPVVISYFASQRQTAGYLLSDEQLLERYRTSLKEETEAFTNLLDNVLQLQSGQVDWEGSHSLVATADNFSDRIGGLNTAAMGSASFDSFVEHYFMKHSQILVKAVTIKISEYSQLDGPVGKDFVTDHLKKSGFDLFSGVISDYFMRDRLVMYLEVGEGHFHTLVPANLLPAGATCLQQAAELSRKRALPDDFNIQRAPVPAAKKPRLAYSSSIEQAAELELLRPSKAKVSDSSSCSFSLFVLTPAKISKCPCVALPTIL